MATDPPGDTPLTHLRGDTYSLEAWVTMFNLLVVVLDPYTHESGWIIPTAGRLFRHYDEADVRVGFIVTADADAARTFLGPYAEEFLVLCDPDRAFVRAAELERLPALLHLRQDASIADAAEGWDPEQWTKVLSTLEQDLLWRSQPVIPLPGDPAPFAGTPALT
jgi:hypothetical protein